MEIIQCSGNQIGTEGVKALSEMLTINTSLSRLDLSGNEMIVEFIVLDEYHNNDRQYYWIGRSSYYWGSVES